MATEPDDGSQSAPHTEGAGKDVLRDRFARNPELRDIRLGSEIAAHFPGLAPRNGPAA